VKRFVKDSRVPECGRWRLGIIDQRIGGAMYQSYCCCSQMCLAVPCNVWRRLEGVTINHASTIEVDHHDRGDDWNGESEFHCFLNLLASQNPQLAISY